MHVQVCTDSCHFHEPKNTSLHVFCQKRFLCWTMCIPLQIVRRLNKRRSILHAEKCIFLNVIFQILEALLLMSTLPCSLWGYPSPTYSQLTLPPPTPTYPYPYPHLLPRTPTPTYSHLPLPPLPSQPPWNQYVCLRVPRHHLYSFWVERGTTK